MHTRCFRVSLGKGRKLGGRRGMNVAIIAYEAKDEGQRVAFISDLSCITLFLFYFCFRSLHSLKNVVQRRAKLKHMVRY